MIIESIENKSRMIGRIVVKAFGLSPSRDNLAYYVLIKKQVYILKLKSEDPLTREKMKQLSNKLVLLSGTIINHYVLIASNVTELSNLKS